MPSEVTIDFRGDLRTAVQRALAAMPWLGPSDEALKALALRQAGEIEAAVDRAQELDELHRELGGDPDARARLRALEAHCDVSRVVGLIGPQLTATLRDLGGTPTTRRALRPDQPIGGRLAALRANAPGTR